MNANRSPLGWWCQLSQSTRSYQVLCKIISRTDSTLKLGYLTVRGSPISCKNRCSEGHYYSHHNLAWDWRGRSCHWNLVPILVRCPCHVKNGQNGRRHDEERRGDKVPPRAYPPPGAKRQCDHGVVVEGSVLVEETFGLECFWVGI